MSNKNSYDKSMKRLEEIAVLLDDENINVDEAMLLFEESMKLSEYCYKQLNEYKAKIKILTEEGESDFDEE